MNKNTDKSGQGQGHTPGPWIAQRNDTAYGYDVTADNGRSCVCETINSGHAANARLIAAAPEMLEALRGLVAECEKLPDFHPTLRPSIALRNAIYTISKATGQS